MTWDDTPDLVKSGKRVAERRVNAPGHGRPLHGGIDMSEPTCSIPGCEDPALARSWCNMHWKHWRQHGDPLVGVFRPRATLEQRFWTKVNKNGLLPDHRPELGPCWIWTGSTHPKGYGQFGSCVESIDGEESRRAHRIAYTLMVAPIPEGLELDHLCRVRPCVNPTHLEPVTHAENVRRGAAFLTHCAQGHPFDEVNTYTTSRGSRGCRTCSREANRRCYRRRQLRKRQ